ncbi:chorismate-binding protein, partial [Candidatus Gracilibacteria bacterium]|nr:chorismate-binding protein [Candidatus Gracilibacteria bacterium]
MQKGKVHHLANLEQLEDLQNTTRNKIVFITPFCLAGIEKGYETHGDEKIIAMEVNEELIISKQLLLECLPDSEVIVGEIQESINDEEFGKMVETTKKNIGNGEFNQLIVSREFKSEVDVTEENILSIYKQLLLNTGQYLTFLFNLEEKAFTGATPERHLTIDGGEAIMNPISG